jgi:hypothetical protein
MDFLFTLHSMVLLSVMFAVGRQYVNETEEKRHVESNTYVQIGVSIARLPFDVNQEHCNEEAHSTRHELNDLHNGHILLPPNHSYTH